MQKLRTKLNDGAAPQSLGDSTLVPAEYSLATQGEIARSFGKRFADDVIQLTSGDWTGPVHSAYGIHLVKVSERIEANLPRLAEIRPLVEREYLMQKRNEQKDLAYQTLRKGYEVTIEPIKIESVNTAQATAGEAK